MLLRCRLRNLSYTLSTKVGGETSIGRRQLEGIVQRRQARPRVLWKLINREEGRSKWGTRYVRPLQFDSHSLVLLSRFFQIWSTVGSWTVGSSTHPSSISVMIHPLPHIKTKKPRARVVRKALPMIDISQEDGEKDQEHSRWWWSGSYGVRML